MASSLPPRAAFYVLFVASGFAGLIYESIWTHYLKLFLGHAAYAQSLVLAVFMGGMAAGAAALGRVSPRLANPLLGYALVEAVIGVLALAFHELFGLATDWSYAALLPALGGEGPALAAKLALSCLLILPQSVLLGMTFPLMSAGLARAHPAAAGESIAMLYFTNSLGAAFGVLASGFLLIEAFGLPGTLRVAGLINLLLAAAVAVSCGSSRRWLATSGVGLARSRSMSISRSTASSRFVFSSPCRHSSDFCTTALERSLALSRLRSTTPARMLVPPTSTARIPS